MLLRSLLIFLSVPLLAVNCVSVKYHNNTELEEYLKNFVKTTTGDVKASLYSIGKSAKGNHLWVVNVTAVKRHKPGIPNIKFVGTIHGNEPVGRETLLYFMEFLRYNYHTQKEVRWLLDNARIHFLPNMNPDGFNEAFENKCDGEFGRNNGKRNMDLNRNFPDYFHKRRVPEESETKAVRQWMRNVPFILSGGLHGGALVANYPFDSVEKKTSQIVQPPSLSPDDDVFRYLASTYAQNHRSMYKGLSCGNTVIFDGGITNGATWYSFSGGMQDYNYAIEGCMEVTLEISCCKYPKAEKLPELWEENKMALLKYSLEALKGVTGQIFDSTTLKPVAGAALKVSGRNMTFFSKQTGEFWRLLLPGSYKLEVSADGYYDKVVDFQVNNYSDTLPELTFLKVLLVNSSRSTTTSTTEQVTTIIEDRFEKTTADAAGISTNTFVDIPEQARQIISMEDETKSSGRLNSLHSYLSVFVLFYYVILL